MWLPEDRPVLIEIAPGASRFSLNPLSEVFQIANNLPPLLWEVGDIANKENLKDSRRQLKQMTENI